MHLLYTPQLNIALWHIIYVFQKALAPLGINFLFSEVSSEATCSSNQDIWHFWSSQSLECQPLLLRSYQGTRRHICCVLIHSSKVLTSPSVVWSHPCFPHSHVQRLKTWSLPFLLMALTHSFPQLRSTFAGSKGFLWTLLDLRKWFKSFPWFCDFDPGMNSLHGHVTTVVNSASKSILLRGIFKNHGVISFLLITADKIAKATICLCISEWNRGKTDSLRLTVTLQVSEKIMDTSRRDCLDCDMMTTQKTPALAHSGLV